MMHLNQEPNSVSSLNEHINLFLLNFHLFDILNEKINS